jgi:hypothetical protein
MGKCLTLIGGVLLCSMFARAQDPAAPGNAAPAVHIAGNPAQSELLWQKLDATVQHVNRDLDGTMGVAMPTRFGRVGRSSEYGRIVSEWDSR